MMDEKDREDKSDEENGFEKGRLYYFMPRDVDSRGVDMNIPGHVLAKYVVPHRPRAALALKHSLLLLLLFFKGLRLEYGLPSTCCSSFLPEAKPFTIVLDALDECAMTEFEGVV